LLAEELMVFVTGIPSPGKTRLKAALDAADLSLNITLRVHAETDLEAMLEPAALRETRAAAAKADIVIPVDWESPENSVKRVIAVLAKGAARGA
jgi:hypothetical protein